MAWNGCTAPGPRIDAGDLDFARDGVAVDIAGTELTWSDLGALVLTAEASVSAAGLAAGSRVLVRMPLGIGYVVMLLALLRRRAVVIPIGDAAPARFVDHIRKIAIPAAEVDAAGQLKAPAVRETAADPREGSSAGHDMPAEAYIMFTSGSTGTPKGVIGSRDGLSARLGWGVRAFFSDEVVRCAARTNPVFLDSLTEILGALHAYRTLVIAPSQAMSDLHALAQFLDERGVQQATITPSCLPVLAQYRSGNYSAMRRWILSGEPLRQSWARAARRLSPDAEIINSYGSTEVAGDVTFLRIGRHDAVPSTIALGTAVPGVSWALGPADGHEAAIPRADAKRDTTVGELLIAGSQVAVGYLEAGPAAGSPFVVASSASDAVQRAPARWFRTGDLVSSDGAVLTYVGRLNDVHKIRGRRVDLGAVTGTIDELTGVSEVALDVAHDDHGAARLQAYVVPEDRIPLTPEALRRGLADRLPPHLIPDGFTILAHMPRSTTGKIDRQALKRITSTATKLSRSEFASDLELAIATVMVRCAPGLIPDRTAPFATLGIDSFQAFAIAEELGNTLGVAVSVLDLVAWQTIEHSAASVLGASQLATPAVVRSVRAGRADRVIVMLPPAIGNGLCFFRLLPHLDADHTVAFVEETGPALDALEAGGCAHLAAFLAREIAATHPVASISLLGWSFGALLAPHCQHELTRLGVSVDHLVLLDPGRVRSLDTRPTREWAIRRILSDFGYELPRDGLHTVNDALAFIGEQNGALRQVSPETFLQWVRTIGLNAGALVEDDVPAPTVSTLIIRGARTAAQMAYPEWVAAAFGGAGDAWFAHVDADVSHFDLLSESFVGELGRVVGGFLQQ